MSRACLAAVGEVSALLRVPKGTPFLQGNSAEHASCLSVVSYNLLAPAYVRPVDTRTGEVQDFAGFPWVSEADLNWEKRRSIIQRELALSRADVICLQEVQFVKQASSATKKDPVFELPPFLNLEGYHAVLPPQADLTLMAERNLRVLSVPDSPVGNALLVATDRLRVVAEDPSGTRCLSVCLLGKGPLANLAQTAVSCLHLDASSEEKRAQQLRTCCERLRTRFRVHHIILAGDFNTECEPGTVISRFCRGERPPTNEELIKQWQVDARTTREPTEQEQKKWQALHEEALAAVDALRVNLTRIPVGPTRAGWDHGSEAPPCVSWKLDHIWVSSCQLAARTVWETLEVDPASAKSGLPNSTCPSDHLPVGVSFALAGDPALTGEAKTALTTRLDAHRQACDALLAAVEKTKEGEQKEKGGKRAKPSPEEIAALQAKRAQKKQLLQELEERRKTFWQSLSEREKDEVEDLGFDSATV